MKRNLLISAILVLLFTVACTCFGLGAGLSVGSQKTPEDTVREVLIEASQGDEQGILKYAYDGIDTSSEWPGDLLYYCRGIMTDKEIYQTDSFKVNYTDDEHAQVSVKPSGGIFGGATFHLVIRDGKWYIIRGPGYGEAKSICD